MAEAALPPSPSGDGEKGVEGDEQKIPYSRFKEVNDKLKAYAELGDPEQIAALIDQHAQLTEALKRQETKTPDPKPTSTKSKIPEEKRAEILQQLNDVLGFDLSALAPALGEVKARVDGSDEQRLSTLRSQAATKVAQLAKAEGYSEEATKRIEKLVASEVYENDKLLKRFFAGDLSVVEEAFAKENEAFFSSNMVKPLKKKAPSLSVLNGAEGMVTEKPGKVLSDEEINKLPPQQRARAMGEKAWNFYHAQLAAKQEAGE